MGALRNWPLWRCDCQFLCYFVPLKYIVMHHFWRKFSWASFWAQFSKTHLVTLLYFKVVVLDYKSIICPGKTFVMHLQALIEEVTLRALICLVSRTHDFRVKIVSGNVVPNLPNKHRAEEPADTSFPVILWRMAWNAYRDTECQNNWHGNAIIQCPSPGIQIKCHNCHEAPSLIMGKICQQKMPTHLLNIFERILCKKVDWSFYRCDGNCDKICSCRTTPSEANRIDLCRKVSWGKKIICRVPKYLFTSCLF
jgi:hypothetical protein